jgi:hypothetical protein
MTKPPETLGQLASALIEADRLRTMLKTTERELLRLKSEARAVAAKPAARPAARPSVNPLAKTPECDLLVMATHAFSPAPEAAAAKAELERRGHHLSPNGTLVKSEKQTEP